MNVRSTMRLVGVLGSLLWTCVSAADQLPDLRFTEEKYDIGCVGVDFKIYHIIKMVNYGQDTIHIDTMTGHCDCTEVRFRDSVVAPGDTASGLMIFNTADMYGPVEKDIRVYSSDSKSHYAYLPYTATVGQWLMGVEPKPVSVFFLPGQKSRISSLLNHDLERITLEDIRLDADLVEVRKVQSSAGKGENLEIEVTPKATLPPGTHITYFTAIVGLPQGAPPLRITIPVKVVKY